MKNELLTRVVEATNEAKEFRRLKGTREAVKSTERRAMAGGVSMDAIGRATGISVSTLHSWRVADKIETPVRELQEPPNHADPSS